MAYSPTTWETGDVITADKLNHIEEGIEETEIIYTDPNNDGNIIVTKGGN